MNQGSIFCQKNTLKKWNTSMVHTNHFIHGGCTGMNVIQRCLSHLHEPWRCDKHLFSVCRLGLLSWKVRLIMSNIHNAQSFLMDDSLTDSNSSPQTVRLSFSLQSMLCMLAPSHFVRLGNNMASPTPPSPITSMVANLHPLLTNARNCSPMCRRWLS